MKIPKGLNTDLGWCSSVESTCENLIVPRSNSMQLDRCIRFACHIDRNSRQRPVRCEDCKAAYGAKE